MADAVKIAFAAAQHCLHMRGPRNTERALSASRLKMTIQEDSDFFAPQPAAQRIIFVDRISELMDRSRAAIRRYVVRTQTERAVSKLSDRLLADIGITRSEIAAFSVNAARRAKH